MIKLWIYNFTSDLVTKEIIHNLIHYIYISYGGYGGETVEDPS